MTVAALRLAGAAFILAAAVSAAASTQTTAPAPAAESSDVAEEHGAPDQESQRTATAPEEKKICRKMAEIGSRMADKTVCMTRKQWRRAGH